MEPGKEEIINELKINPKVAEWLNKFEYGDPEKFLEAYATAKINMINNPKDYSIKEKYRTAGHTLAEDAFKALLGKKLFNLEALWRAEEIDIEGIELSVEFMNWTLDVYNCLFIPEVTEKEIQILIDYLNRPDFRDYDIDGYNHWFYDDFINKKEDYEVRAKKFFAYYDSKIKNKISLNKPDLRKEKEDYYLKVYEDNLTEKKPVTTAKPIKESKIADFKERCKALNKIAKSYGNNDYQTYLKNRQKYFDGYHGYDTLYSINYLKFFYNEEIPLQANKSWVESIKQAHEGHKAKVAIAHLPEVISIYRFKRENNMLNPNADKSFDRLVIREKEQILKARKFLGEPENLEF